MKQLITLFFLALVTPTLSAQQVLVECQNVVDLTIESINSHSSEKLNRYLSDDFTMAGQKGPIAKLVLNQLLSQLGETVLSHEEISHDTVDKTLELKYNVAYEKMGAREATFIFNEHNLLEELHLFKMEVKTMKNETVVKKSNQDIIEVPFTMAGKLIALDVLLNGQKRKFILDSGAPKVILNSKYVVEKDTTRRSISSSKGVSGNISGMDILKVAQLDFNGIQLNNQEVLTMNLAHLEEELETAIYGLIGFDLIKDYDVVFDYKQLKITLINPDIFMDYKKKKLSDKRIQTVPFKLEGHIPVIEAQVGKKNLSFGIDCGAESNLIDDDLFRSLKKCTKQVHDDGLIGADNNKIMVKTGMIRKTKIGGTTFKNLITVFSDLSHLNQGYQLNLDGLIGYEVLSKQTSLISYHRKELLFIE